MARRSSSVAAAARAAARERRGALLEERRKREQRINELADAHAVAVAMAEEVRARAEREIAGHLAEGDRVVAELLGLGEGAEAVGAMLGLSAAEVRAARRRTRGESSAGDGGSSGGDAGGAAVRRTKRDGVASVAVEPVGEGAPSGA